MGTWKPVIPGMAMVLLLAGYADAQQKPGPASENPDLDGRTIIEMAQQAAGGETFVSPGTLLLSGYNVIYEEGGGSQIWNPYAMWRVFANLKTDSHAASGKVRIEAWSNARLALLLSYDGEATYDESGRVADQSANAIWGSNFGFGAIRNALDEGWMQQRRADRTVDGKPAYMVELTDPDGGKTLFGFEQGNFDILYVGFDTPRGWHERRYSDYFSKPGISWRQAGRVGLFYNGIKTNEAVWSDFEVGEIFPDDIFVIDKIPESPTFR